MSGLRSWTEREFHRRGPEAAKGAGLPGLSWKQAIKRVCVLLVCAYLLNVIRDTGKDFDNTGAWAFTVLTSFTWHNLRQHVTSAITLQVYRAGLKTYLYAYSIPWISYSAYAVSGHSRNYSRLFRSFSEKIWGCLISLYCNECFVLFGSQRPWSS